MGNAKMTMARPVRPLDGRKVRKLNVGNSWHRLTPERIERALIRGGTHGDGDNLFLLVGHAMPRWVVRFGRRNREFTLGYFPEIGVEEARVLAAEMCRAWVGYMDMHRFRRRLLARFGFRQIRPRPRPGPNQTA